MNTSIEETTVVVKLDKIKIYAYHGLLPQEKTVGNWYEVSVTISFATQAVFTDDINDTINYAAIAEVVRHQMLTPSKLLEHVAGRTAKSIKEQFPEITTGTITITKLSPPIQELNSDGVSVTLNF